MFIVYNYFLMQVFHFKINILIYLIFINNNFINFIPNHLIILDAKIFYFMILIITSQLIFIII